MWSLASLAGVWLLLHSGLQSARLASLVLLSLPFALAGGVGVGVSGVWRRAGMVAGYPYSDA